MKKKTNRTKLIPLITLLCGFLSVAQSEATVDIMGIKSSLESTNRRVFRVENDIDNFFGLGKCPGSKELWALDVTLGSGGVQYEIPYGTSEWIPLNAQHTYGLKLDLPSKKIAPIMIASQPASNHLKAMIFQAVARFALFDFQLAYNVRLGYPPSEEERVSDLVPENEHARKFLSELGDGEYLRAWNTVDKVSLDLSRLTFVITLPD